VRYSLLSFSIVWNCQICHGGSRAPGSSKPLGLVSQIGESWSYLGRDFWGALSRLLWGGADLRRVGSCKSVFIGGFDGLVSSTFSQGCIFKCEAYLYDLLEAL